MAAVVAQIVMPRELPELLTPAVVAVVVAIKPLRPMEEQAARAVLALSSCPTAWRKAHRSSSNPRHRGLHRLAQARLIIWLLRAVVAVVAFKAAAVGLEDSVLERHLASRLARNTRLPLVLAVQVLAEQPQETVRKAAVQFLAPSQARAAAVARVAATHPLPDRLAARVAAVRVDNRRMRATHQPQHHHKAVAAAAQTTTRHIIRRAAAAVHRLSAQMAMLLLAQETAAQEPHQPLADRPLPTLAAAVAAHLVEPQEPAALAAVAQDQRLLAIRVRQQKQVLEPLIPAAVVAVEVLQFLLAQLFLMAAQAVLAL